MPQTDLNRVISRQLNTLQTADIDYTNDIPSFCVSSAAMEKNILEQVGGEFLQKAQIHCIMLEPFASGKSTLYEQIPEKAKYLLYNVTSAGFHGSIQKDGRISKGVIERAAGKCLIIDEIQNIPSSVKTSMLALFEQQRYSRSLGYSVSTPYKKRGKYFSIDVKGNNLEVKCRFSCLAGGNYVKRETYVDKAWWSRMVPVQITRDRHDMYNVIRGKSHRKIDYHPIPKGFPAVRFPKKLYLNLVDEHERVGKILPFAKTAQKLEEGFLTRNTLDHTRMACYLAARDGRTVVEEDDVRYILNYIPISLYNTLCASMTYKEYAILTAWHKGVSNQNEIAERLEVSKSYVSETMAELKNKGLIW